MTCYETNLPEERPHHFLFHIFTMDKAINPMPLIRVEELLNQLKTALQKKENWRD